MLKEIPFGCWNNASWAARQIKDQDQLLTNPNYIPWTILTILTYMVIQWRRLQWWNPFGIWPLQETIVIQWCRSTKASGLPRNVACRGGRKKKRPCVPLSTIRLLPHTDGCRLRTNKVSIKKKVTNTVMVTG